MIKFALACAGGHEFESWFQSSEAYDAQAKAGLLVCPLCRSAKVAKAVMAPSVAHSRGTKRPGGTEEHQPPASVALLDRRDEETRALLKAFRKRVFETAEDVGPRFAEEARKIHRELAPERPIRGQASLEEAQALIEEGIGVLPVPPLPDEWN